MQMLWYTERTEADRRRAVNVHSKSATNMKHITPASLLRSVILAVLFTVVLHLLADYFGWKMFSEAGGVIL
jgi:hypothetical protein